MPTLVSQVEALAGSSTSPTSYATQLTQWFDDGVKFITDSVIAAQETNIDMFTNETASFSVASPYTLTDGMKVASVICTTAGVTRIAHYVEPGRLYDMRDTGSIHYRTVRDPAYTICNSKIELAGEGTTNIARVVGYGVVTDGATPSISRFPKSLYRSLVLYAAVKLLQAKGEELTGTDEDIELARAQMAHAEALQAELMGTLKPYGVSV